MILELRLKPGVARPAVGAPFSATGGETTASGIVTDVRDLADGVTVVRIRLTEAENLDVGFFHSTGAR